MTKLNPIALAVPVFLLLIGLEVWLSRRRGLRVYRFADAITDLACGVEQQLVGAFLSAALLAGYAWVYEHHRLITFAPGSLWPWVIAFVGVDFVYYWWHRASHEVALLWAAHVVHHSSEDFNLAVALRQSVSTSVTFFPFWLPLALVGVPPLHVALNLALSLLYQFWIHTELISRLGWAEQVLNTPSHHRVHHARNPRYLDRNYGGTFIVWDRLFGTYEPEREPCVYGIVHPLRSFNSFWAQLHLWVDLVRQTLRAPRLGDKLRLWVKPPGWSVPGLPPKAPPPEVSREEAPKHEVPVGRGLAWYVGAQFALVIVATLVLMQWKGQLALATRVGLTAAVAVSLLAWGGLFERRRWAQPLEIARLTVLGAIGTALAWQRAPALSAAIAVLAAGLLAWDAGLLRASRAAEARMG